MVNFKKILFLLIFSFSFCLGNIKNLSIEKQEKIIIFAPHPDDEILACAGLIQKIIKNQGEVYIVYLTNGDHNQLPYRIYEKKIILNPTDYIKLGEIRRKESIKATGILGIPKENLIFLGYPDFGTLKIWENYWGQNKPYKSFLTKVSYVPYKENYSFGRPYISESILTDIKEILKDIKPTKIFTTSPYDTNVDHRALYNFIRVAILEQEIKPEIFIYLIHFKNYPGKSEKLILPDIFSIFEIYNISLDEKEIENKKVALECFKSQTIFKKNWFYSFVKSNEIFYKENDLKLKSNIIMESEKEAEYNEYKNISLPFYVNLKNKGEFLEVEFIHKKKTILPTYYVFYFFPFKEQVEFSKMPKIKINLKKENEILTSLNYLTPTNQLKYEKSKDKFNFKIKYEDINYPDYLFFSANIKIGNINYDFIPWEVIKIEY